MRDSSITTESIKADGGNIEISASFEVSLIDSKITASVGGGPQTTGGNITIDPQYVILKNSQIIANAFEGRGGNILINTNVFLADPDSVVDASSALGINGTVDIRALITNVSGLLTPLSTDYVSATALLRESCMARIRGGKYSSFVVGGRDGLPIEPGNLLPGLMH
jgi:large exoprotein involved in heme utilization and adhesion